MPQRYSESEQNMISKLIAYFTKERDAGKPLLALTAVLEAKSDGITPLERFRNKSEPTWLFISKGKMVNLMFGADAPKLRRLILDELAKEQAELEGQPTDRTPMEVTELAEEEKVRYDAAETIEHEIREKEEKKRAKELFDRRKKECEHILSNLPNYGTALVFPSARDKYKDVLNEILDEAGLNIHQTEKVQLDENVIKEICFFRDISEEFSEEALEQLYNDESVMILFKISARSENEDVDDAILTMVYGHTKMPPGTDDSAIQKIIKLSKEVEAEEEVVETEKEKEIKTHFGLWVPPTPQERAITLRLFFPKESHEFTIPEPPPEPEHLAIIFPLDKKDKVLQVIRDFPNAVMKQGIFTSENCDETTLVAKSFKKLDKISPSQRTYSEKLVFQVSKQKSECVFNLALLAPLYMSPNAKEGKAECQKFFPDDYESDEEEEEEEEEPEEENEEGVDESAAIDESEKGVAQGGEDTELKSEEGSEIPAGEKPEGEEGEKLEAEGDAAPEVAANQGGVTESSEIGGEPLPALPDPPSEEPVAE